MTDKRIDCYLAFSQLTMTAPKSEVPVSANWFTSSSMRSTGTPSVMMASR